MSDASEDNSAATSAATFSLGSDFPYAALSQPTDVGPYHLLEVLGEGGMGVVYRAEQREPVRRTVALKLIKLGMDTKEVIARFESERQALAMMSHPNVAKVLDAGATESGRPFFVMEYVPGEPITSYCDKHQLTVQQRLELFTQACAALEHAHQKALIHRDIKPSNVLVMLQDGKPLVKVIDFGVAKATNQRLTERTVFTERGQLIGTPEYMSPEQAEMSGIDVDTRSDIYSLGVLLYELLTGVLPFDPKSLRSAAFGEIQRIIREVDPPRPSTRLSTLGPSAAEIARRRQTQIDALARQLRSELEWIPLKAMRKDPQQRYRTVSELAEDIGNYLSHRPLSAGPESVAYRARKFVRRNKALVASATAVLVVLVLGVIGTTAGFVRAERQRRDALAARDSAQAVSEFLTKDVIGSADPGVMRGRDLSVREALDNAANNIAQKFVAHPLTEASVRTSVALAYQSLGRADVGLPHAQKALELRRTLLGADHPETLQSMHVVALLMQSLGKYFEAEKLYDRVIAARARVLGADDYATLESMHNLASVYEAQARYADAERLLRRVLDARRVTPGLDDPGTIATAGALALVLQGQGKYDEAEPLLRDALSRARRVRGTDHPQALTQLTNLAMLVQSRGDLAGAEPLYREALELARRVLGDDHPNTLTLVNGFVTLLKDLGKLDEAETLARQALERSRRASGGDDHPNTPYAVNNLATVLQTRGKLSEAEAMFREALALYRRNHGDEHESTLVAMNNLAGVLTAQGRLDDAERIFTDALDGYRAALGADHPDTLVLAGNLGMLLNMRGKLAEAETLLRDTLERARRAIGSDHPSTTTVANALALTLKDQGKLDEAEPLSRQVLETFRRTLGNDHRNTLTSMNNLAKLLQAQGKRVEAEQMFRESLDGFGRTLGGAHPTTLMMMSNLTMLLVEQGRWADAEPLAAELYRGVTEGGAQVSPQQSAVFIAWYGPCLVKLGRFDVAEPPLRRAYEVLRETDQHKTRPMLEVLSSLAELCDRTNRPDEATKWRAEAATLGATTRPPTRPAQ